MRRTSYRHYHQVQPLSMAHLPTSSTRMSVETKRGQFQRMYIAQGPTAHESHCCRSYNGTMCKGRHLNRCRGGTGCDGLSWDLVFRALHGATCGGLGAPTTQWDGANRQAPPDKPPRRRTDSPSHHLFSVETSCHSLLFSQGLPHGPPALMNTRKQPGCLTAGMAAWLG
jgi:hypothetical protein